MIGKTINRYKIIGNINNRVVMAHNPNAVEPWVVWWLTATEILTAAVTLQAEMPLPKNLWREHFV